jgi:hypothetical protein
VEEEAATANWKSLALEPIVLLSLETHLQAYSQVRAQVQHLQAWAAYFRHREKGQEVVSLAKQSWQCPLAL